MQTVSKIADSEQNTTANNTPLTVMICAYNAEDTLAEQLTQLAPQINARNAELLVVDNRSTDNTVQLVSSFMQRIHNLKLVRADRQQGKAYAMNVGVEAATSPRIAMTDADDIVGEGWVDAMYQGLLESELCTGPMDMHSLNPERAWSPVPTWGKEPQLGFLPFMSGSNMGFHKSLFLQVGGMPADFGTGEDIDISWRMQLAGGRLKYDENALVRVRYRNSSWQDWLQTFRFARAHVMLYKRYRSQGMPGVSRGEVRQRYRRLWDGIRYWHRQTDEGRYLWRRKLAVSLGYLAGSLRYRVWYL